MTDAPTFLRRKPVEPSVEDGLRSLLANLRSQASTDTFAVLADATNAYLGAVVRFTGQGKLAPVDIDHLLTVWQIMLDVGQRGRDFASGKTEVATEQE